MKTINLDTPLPPITLLHGYSGSGKTSFMGTYPNLAVLASESSSTIGALQDLKARTGQAPVTVRVPETQQDVFDFLNWLETPAARSSVQSVGFDSFTDLQNLLMLQVIDEHQQVFGHVARVSDVPEQADWQRILIPTIRILRRLQSLGYAVVVTCHVRSWIDPIERPRARQLLAQHKTLETVPQKFYPALRGQLADTMPHFFNIVGFMRFEPSGERRVYFRESATFFAKAQVSTLPDYIAQPTYEKLMLGLQGKLLPDLASSAAGFWTEAPVAGAGVVAGASSEEESTFDLEPGVTGAGSW